MSVRFLWKRLWRKTQLRVVKPIGKLAKSNLRLTFCDRNEAMTDAWLEAFYGVDGVEIVQGDLLKSGAEAVVSPANSFGDMSGGLDKHLDDFFGGRAQELVTDYLNREFFGELPVGMAVVLPLVKREISFLVVAPTMRIPAPVPTSLNAYLAFRAALVAVLKHNALSQTPIRSLAVSGLCTGVGEMLPAVSARQVRAAYDSVIGGKWHEVTHPAQAPFAFSGSIQWTPEEK